MNDSHTSPSPEELLAALRELQGRLDRLEEAIGRMHPPAPAPAPPPPQAVRPPLPAPPPVLEPFVPPVPPAAAPAPAPAAPADEPGEAAPPRATASLEQRLGTQWMLFVGVGVLLLAGFFFFKYAIERDWISPTLRVLAGAAGGLAMIGLGEWTLLRRKMRPFAAGVMGGGIVLLYFVVFLASPNGWYQLIGAAPAFVLMCLVTACGMGLSLQTGMLSTAIVSLLGALATPVMLSTGENRQVFLMSYLLLVNAGFLAVGLLKGWPVLGALALAGTTLIFGGWCAEHFERPAWQRTCLFGWLFWAEFLAFVCVGAWRKRMAAVWGQVLLGLAGAALAVLCLGMNQVMPQAWFFGSLLALTTVTLAVGLWRDWPWLGAAALAWSAAGWAVRGAIFLHGPQPPAERWQLVGWAWALFAALSADVFVRAFRRGRAMREPLHATLGALATAGMFVGTYLMLREPHAEWMGAYAAGLGTATIVAAWAFYRLAGRRWLAYAWLGQGLVLLAVAVPIQFDRAAVPIAWAAQGVVAMFLARRLRNVLLLVKSPVVLLLAAGHFFSRIVAGALAPDPRLTEVAFTLAGTPITFGLLLAAGLTVAILAAAAILRAGPALFEEQGERFVAIAMTAGAAVVLGVRTGAELPATAATWCWLALAAGLAGVGLWRRSRWLMAAGGLALLGVAGKWGLFDTLYLRGAYGADAALLPLANWQLAAGVVTAAGLIAHVSASVRRGGGEQAATALRATATVVAAVMIVYAGSFEIDRYFASGRGQWADTFQAQQTAYSVWWAVYAAGLMALGFARSSRVPRYLAMALFAVTLGKVFLVDMAKVETVYRILSFLCLGSLLVAASWLYHRYFREKPAT